MNKTVSITGPYDLVGEIKKQTINKADYQDSKRNTKKGCKNTKGEKLLPAGWDSRVRRSGLVNIQEVGWKSILFPSFVP